jgi:YD repeat-containing protein
VREKDEYDYGQSAPLRKTLTAYQSFQGTLGAIADEPCKTVVYDGSGHAAAETDYLYDGGANICGGSGIPSVAGAGGSSLTGHDETNFSPGSKIPRGNLTTKIQRANAGASPSTSYTYDETGQVTSMTDPNGNVTHYSYADNFVNSNTGSFTTTAGSPASGKTTNANLTEVVHPPTNGVQHIEKYSYGYNDAELTTSTDQNQQVTTYRYDDLLDRPTETDYPDGGQTQITYNDTAPNPTITTSKELRAGTSMRGTTVTDGMGHIVQTQLTSDPLGSDLTDSTYTGQGLLNTQSNPHRSASLSTDGTKSYVYDGLGRVCLVVLPGGTAASSCPTSAPPNDVFTSYLGNTTTITDPAGKARKSFTDALGRLTSVFEDPNGLNYQTDYQYDPLDNLLSVTQKGGSSQANWRVRTFTYDSLSRLLRANNPESGIVQYSYDPNGNLVTKTDARGTIVSMHYDALNRPLSKTFSDGTPPVTLYYDGAPAPWAGNEQNTNGRLVEVITGTTPQP